MVPEAVISCLLSASLKYDIPPAILYSIMKVEGGETGMVNKNTNDSFDIGVMQINSLWLPELANHWNVSNLEAAYVLANDPCVNINVASWILKQKIKEAEGSLINGIAYYHSKNPSLGKKYAMKVYDTLKKNDLLK